MVTLTHTEVEVASFYVTVGWVAKHYDVPRLAVHRAIKDGRLLGLRIGGNVYVLDRRRLPDVFPRR